jgi:hypothetical protein
MSYSTLAVGAPGSDKAYLLHGGPDVLLPFPVPTNYVHNVILNGADQTFSGELGSSFGESLTTRIDANGDSWADLLVGAPDATGTGGTVGAVYEFLNTTDKPADRTTAESDYTIWGTQALGRFGAHIAGVGEMAPSPYIIPYPYLDDFVAGAPAANAAYVEY